MPGREIPLVTDQIYHIFNRGVARQPIFRDKRDYRRFTDLMFYYQNKEVPVRFSKFLKLPTEERTKSLVGLLKNRQLVAEIFCYCLMPNHFHLLLQQVETGGISKYLANLTNSYTKYFNTKTSRDGPLVQGKFKAVRIESNEQLMHISRYIHLNPYSSFVVKTLEELSSYPYSSLPEYLMKSNQSIVEKDIILSNFKSIKSFQRFTFDHADYQRKLHELQHLLLENS